MKKHTKLFLIPCTAMTLALGSAVLSYAATGWTEENGEWSYYNTDGSKSTDVFRKSGENWFYLNSDGVMAKDALIELDDNLYYVDENGAMVTNQWRAIENENAGSDDEPDEWWYYFQSNGRAVKKADDSDSVKFVTLSSTKGSHRYTFDDEGRMLFGWLDENGERLTEDDAWKSGVYYCGENGDGAMSTGWRYITAPNDEDRDRDGDGYWFYFTSNGKKTANTDSKKINGRKYSFNEYGAAQFEWYNNPASTSNATQYYNGEDQCWLSTGWFKAVPDENFDPEGYDEGELHWYYSDSSGDLVTAQIKRIDGQSYGFDQYGKMLKGLYKIEFEADGRTIASAEEIEDEANLPDEDEDVYVYYFGDSAKEGALKTGAATLEIGGETYYYSFQKSGSKKGAGVDGIESDSIYVKGRRLEAEAGSKYQPITYKDETYLVSTAGKLVKNKKNVKDTDGTYYKTDSLGRILDSSDEKFT